MSTDQELDVNNGGLTDEVYVFPASFAQQRLWLIDQMATEKSAYNVWAALEVKGALDLRALEAAFNEIVRRHETLRTTFDSDDGEPIQVISPSLTFKVKVVDLQLLPERERHTHALERAKDEAHLPFDLARGPLLRVTVYRLSPTDHVLLLTIHHIISDAWSIGILMKELEILYPALRSGQTPALPELPVQYADYAEWQREWLKEGAFDQQLAYWRQQLSGSPAELALPLDRPRPSVKSGRGDVESRTIAGEAARRLKSLGQREGATAFMLSLALFDVLLARYTGQTDIVVGSPITNRTRIEIEKLIGFFLNTLVFRVDLSGAPSFREILRRVRDVCLQAFGNQDLPFEKLVEELQPERRLSLNPLFQVMFVYQNDPAAGHRIRDLELHPLEVTSRTSKFDLILFMQETPEGLCASFEYDTDLFERSTIQRMASHLQKLLESIVANPDQPINRLEWLTPEEKKQLTVDWNSTAADFRRDLCAHQLFEEQASRTPDAPALIFGAARVSYRELNDRADHIAAALRAQGVQPGSLVAIAVERSLDSAAGVLGILKAGAAYVPLDPSYPKERLAFMMEDSRAAVLLTQKQVLERFAPHSARVIRLDDPDLGFGEGPVSPGHAAREAVCEDPAYVIYTSGSTGKPKGVVMPHKPLSNLIAWQLKETRVPAGSKTLQFSPLSFDVSFQEMFSTWAGGGSLVIVSEDQRRDAPSLLELLAKEQVARLFLPFVALQQLAEAADLTGAYPESLKEIITAGEPLQITPAILKWFQKLKNCRLQNQYGPTETHVVTYYTLDGAPEGWPARPPIGKPISNTRVYVLDSERQPVPVGVPGELYLGGEAPAQGYLHRADITAEKFLPDPFSGEEARHNGGAPRMYKSGDLARWLPSGQLEFLGRTDDQVKIRGFRVELGEIETVLCLHPDVREAAAAVRSRGAGSQDQRLVAYIVPRPDRAFRADDLRSFLKQRMPDYMIPSHFVTLQKLPLTPSGKVNRRALPEPVLDREQTERLYVEPRDDVERKLAAIWTSLLDIPKVGVQDNFFEIGGHSLLAVRLIAKIRKEFGKHFPLTILFKASTIEQLAAALTDQDASRRSASLVPIQPQGGLPPIFWPHTLGGGGGGGHFRYKKLVDLIGMDRPSYGIQAPEEPLTTIQSMAEHYIKVIRSKQPQGPYYLAGFCFGGNVAYEMARQLRESGQQVAFLGLLEAWPCGPRNFPWDWRRVRDLSINFYYWLGDLFRQDPRLVWRRFSRRVIRVKHHLFGKEGGGGEDDPQQVPLEEVIEIEEYPEDYLRHAQIHWHALTSYVPPPYDGATTVFRVKKHGLGGYDSTCLWRYYCRGKLDVRTIPGTHETLFDDTHVEIMARELKDALDKARGGSAS